MKVNFIKSPASSSNYSQDDQGHLHKKGLILAEGTWKDSKKRTHTFSSERLWRIADNTNALFQSGERIPILEDHQKTQEKTIGDLNSEVEVREITEEDLPEGKHQHLVGKLGLFAGDIVLKSKRAVEQALDGLLSTISPGVDIISDTIREISATPTPAIPGMSLFKRYEDSRANFNALTFDMMETEQTDFEPIKQQIDELNEKLKIIIENISKADEEELQGYAPSDLIGQALEDFKMRVAMLLGMGGEEQQQGAMMTGNPNQAMAQQQVQGIMQRKMGGGATQYGQYSSPSYVAAFSMADMADFIKAGAIPNPEIPNTTVPKDSFSRKPRGLITQAKLAGRNFFTRKQKVLNPEYMALNKAQRGTSQVPKYLKKRVLTGRGGLVAGGALGLGAMALMPREKVVVKERNLFGF